MKIDTNKAIVPNWYYKDDVENCVGEKLTRKQYLAFYSYVDNSSINDEISDRIRELYAEFNGGK